MNSHRHSGKFSSKVRQLYSPEAAAAIYAEAIRREAIARGILPPDEKPLPAIAQNVPDRLYDFVERIRPTLKVDNQPFTWEDHEYLIEPYKAMAVTGDKNKDGLKIVLQCGAQVGKTVFGFLTEIWLALRFWGNYFGYFLPDQAMADIFSDVRFKPMVKSIPEVKPLWGEDPNADDGDKKKTDRKRVRSIGASQIFFSYMQGTTSTESIPMLALIFDEVRKMLEGDIERAYERISHSPYPIDIKFSTAGYPDANIDKYFKQSNQHKFHSFCKCSDGVVLADVFPDCIATDKDGSFYICPTCRTRIDNPRNGIWVPHNPSSKIIGYHIPQTLSARQDAGKLLYSFTTASDLQEFYNSKLGVAYLSPDAQIVNEMILRATVNPDLKWHRTGSNYAMGIDQMGGFNVITIRKWGPKTDAGFYKSQLVHIEIVYSDDPWVRCDELMREFDIAACVTDALPNINEARRFVQRWPGRAWLADYSYNGSGDDDICEWGDRPKKTNNEKKHSNEILNRFTVQIDRFLGLEWNLMKYVHRMKEQPHERGITATIQDNIGRPIVEWICEKVFWVHLQKLARRKISLDKPGQPQQGKIKMIFENIGIDPHFAHADLYCELALSRINPDGSNKPFAPFAPKAENTDHEWHRENAKVCKCTQCGIAVKATPDQDPQKVATKHGLAVCSKAQGGNQ